MTPLIAPGRNGDGAATSNPAPVASVLITGASTGIGAVFADRFARRGHNLVLVARDRPRLEVLAERLRHETGVTIEILVADLTVASELQPVESRVRHDIRIETLINNAGASLPGTFLNQTPDQVARLISLNVTALSRLACAAAPRLCDAGKGAIVNVGSAVSVAPEFGMTVYGATKAFVLFLSQGLQLELGSMGVYVQALLPASTRTEIWERSGRDVNVLPHVMEAEDLVDAALVGFDAREAVTIPSLPDDEQWKSFDGARKAMLANFGHERPAARYRPAL